MNRVDENFLINRFQIFQQVDMLHAARMRRMSQLRNLTAHQIVRYSGIAFEVCEKMSNLANLGSYHYSYGQTCKQMDKVYNDLMKENQMKKDSR